MLQADVEFYYTWIRLKIESQNALASEIVACEQSIQVNVHYA